MNPDDVNNVCDKFLPLSSFLLCSNRRSSRHWPFDFSHTWICYINKYDNLPWCAAVAKPVLFLSTFGMIRFGVWRVCQWQVVAAVQQLANKDKFCLFGSGSLFIIFHFAQRASATSAAACHVKTLYQSLTAFPRNTHRVHTANTHSACSCTYVGSICSDLSHYSAQFFAHDEAFSPPLLQSFFFWHQICLLLAYGQFYWAMLYWQCLGSLVFKM